MKTYVIFFFISLLLVGCDSKDDYIQDVYVNFYVDLTLPEYNDPENMYGNIGVPGNSIFVNGGVEGIIIYHGFGENYAVYDRNCSYEPSLSCSVIDSVDSGIAYCGCCSSAFLLSSTGEAINSPALLPLKAYPWSVNNNILHITSY